MGRSFGQYRISFFSCPYFRVLPSFAVCLWKANWIFSCYRGASCASVCYVWVITVIQRFTVITHTKRTHTDLHPSFCVEKSCLFSIDSHQNSHSHTTRTTFGVKLLVNKLRVIQGDYGNSHSYYSESTRRPLKYPAFLLHQ